MGDTIPMVATATQAVTIFLLSFILPCKGQGSMFGLDTGNPAADFEAEMWIAALIGTLTAAIPVALLNPGLGFRKKRSLVNDEVRKASIIMESLTKSRPS